jgi:LCP family protein required for cell wall assembly
MDTGRHAHLVPPSRPWLSAARVAGKVVATLVSLLLIVAFWYGWKNYRDLDSGLQRLSIPELGAGPTTAGRSAPRDIDGTDQNILVLGNDDRSDMTDAEVRALHTGRDGGSLNTDTMIIVHVPADGSKATLISLPRDAYVDIPGFRKNRLNAAYPDGYTDGGGTTEQQRKADGVNELVKAIKQLTGLQIDHFLQVDLIGFYRISVAIGTVTVNLCERVDDSYSGLHLPAGINHIVGRNALAFVRQRHGVPGSDLGREKRQQYFLAAAYRKIASLNMLINPSKLSNLIRAVDKSIYVDDAFSIQQLAEQMANLSADNIVGKTIPVEDEEIIDGMDVLVVDPVKVRQFVDQLINGASPAPSTSPAPSASSSTSATTSTSPSSTTSTSSAPIDTGCIH